MDNDTNHRPRSLAEMSELQGRTMSVGDIAQSIASYRAQPTDIVISPFGKCGTTMLQQTFHCLRTRGDMDFDDISRVVPWIETARALHVDLDAPQRGEPRGFKSHLPYDLIPKGARYVISVRDPKDALVSWYRFMEGWWFEPGSVSIDETVRRSISLRGSKRDYWHHLLSWWEQRDNPDVLLLAYEDITADPDSHIRRLAKFCGIALDDALLAITREHASLTFMLQHKDRFDDLMMRNLSETAGGLPVGSDSAKVRKGAVGSHRQELSDEICAEIDAVWAETIAPRTGLKDYTALRHALRRL